jgi:hypothetical protein
MLLFVCNLLVFVSREDGVSAEIRMFWSESRRLLISKGMLLDLVG